MPVFDVTWRSDGVPIIQTFFARDRTVAEAYAEKRVKVFGDWKVETVDEVRPAGWVLIVDPETLVLGNVWHQAEKMPMRCECC